MRKTTTEQIFTGILWISIIVSLFRNPIFDFRFMFTVTAVLLITTLLLIKKSDLALTILFFTLFLSIFNIFYLSTTYNLHLNGLNLIGLLLFITLIIFRWKELLDLKHKWSAIEQEEMDKSRENKINIYKREFKNLSTEELINKLENFKLVEEAKIAVEMILEERKQTIDN